MTDKIIKSTGYCVKCKDKREMKNPSEKRSKTNRLILQGTCDKCGTKVTKFIIDPNKKSKSVKENTEKMNKNQE